MHIYIYLYIYLYIYIYIYIGKFCKELITSSRVHNVTFLMTPSGIGAIDNVCNKTNTKTLTFGQATFAEIKSSQPSSMPSGQPTSVPTFAPIQPKLVTTSLIGFLVIVVLIGILRFYADMIGNKTVKEKAHGHRYDVLVVLNDNQEAVLENINHDDITFYRKTKSELNKQTFDWIMNMSNEALETRHEVKFIDQYDLLHGIEVITNEKRLPAAAKVQIGMIVRVKLGKVKKIKGMDTDTAMNSEMSNTPREKLRYSSGRLQEMLGRMSSPFSNSVYVADDTEHIDHDQVLLNYI
jgi:hypothetical protein